MNMFKYIDIRIEIKTLMREDGDGDDDDGDDDDGDDTEEECTK